MAIKQEPASVPTPEPSLPRKDALDLLYKSTLASAWSLHRYPLQKRANPVKGKTKLHLPRGYLGKDGEDTKVVWEGDDLNQAVYQWYDQLIRNEEANETSTTHVNYVSDGKVAAKRHEYLGPDPRVAGYFFDFDQDIHIRWYDGFLQDQWMDKGKWKMDLKLDHSGNWFIKED